MGCGGSKTAAVEPEVSCELWYDSTRTLKQPEIRPRNPLPLFAWHRHPFHCLRSWHRVAMSSLHKFRWSPRVRLTKRGCSAPSTQHQNRCREQNAMLPTGLQQVLLPPRCRTEISRAPLHFSWRSASLQTILQCRQRSLTIFVIQGLPLLDVCMNTRSTSA